MTASVIGRVLTDIPGLDLVDASVRLERTDEVFRSRLPSDHVPMLLRIGAARAYSPSNRLPKRVVSRPDFGRRALALLADEGELLGGPFVRRTDHGQASHAHR